MSHIQPNTHLPKNKVYRSYTAILNQTGSDAPIATVLYNNLTSDLIWTRFNTGVYEATGDLDVFTTDKTIVIIGTTAGFNFTGNTNSQVCFVNTYSQAGASVDGWLIDTPIEIRVYS